MGPHDGQRDRLPQLGRDLRLEDFSANLYTPILITGGRGHQVINQSTDAPVRAPLFQRPATEEIAAA
jgi:hypothetical protein